MVSAGCDLASGHDRSAVRHDDTTERRRCGRSMATAPSVTTCSGGPDRQRTGGTDRRSARPRSGAVRARRAPSPTCAASWPTASEVTNTSSARTPTPTSGKGAEQRSWAACSPSRSRWPPMAPWTCTSLAGRIKVQPSLYHFAISKTSRPREHPRRPSVADRVRRPPPRRWPRGRPGPPSRRRPPVECSRRPGA